MSQELNMTGIRC